MCQGKYQNKPDGVNSPFQFLTDNRYYNDWKDSTKYFYLVHMYR